MDRQQTASGGPIRRAGLAGLAWAALLASPGCDGGAREEGTTAPTPPEVEQGYEAAEQAYRSEFKSSRPKAKKGEKAEANPADTP